MKRAFTLGLLVIASSAASFGQSPISLSAGTIPSGPVPAFVASAITSGVQSPMRGTNMAWNYSNLATTIIEPLSFVPTTIAQVPSANFALENQFAELVPSYGYNYNSLFAHNAMYYGIVGRQTPAQSYSMLPATGIASDSLSIPSQVSALSTAARTLAFPATYNSVWTNNYQFGLQAQVDVTPFGLNNAPMEKRSFVLSQDSVIGWGTLQVPTQTGPSMPYPVLMVKHTSITTDSVYLNGAPAPPALLSAMGLTQGQITRDNRYRFFRNGSMMPLAEFRYGASPFSMLTDVNYDRSSSVQPNGLAEELATFPVQLYPNPAAGNQLYLRFEAPQNPNWHFTLTDLAGRQVHSQVIGTAAESHAVALPANAANGLYLWQLTDEHGTPKAAGKVSLAH